MDVSLKRLPPDGCGPRVNLKSSVILYTLPDVMSSWKNVRILSNDGHYFLTNQSVLLANCKMLKSTILKQDSLQEAVAISTELDKDTLGDMINFFATGLISKESIAKPEILDAFASFGIDFSKLVLSEADATRIRKVRRR